MGSFEYFSEGRKGKIFQIRLLQRIRFWFLKKAVRLSLGLPDDLSHIELEKASIFYSFT